MSVIERNIFPTGTIVRHFKRDFCSQVELMTNKYLYEVVGTAMHTETKELMLVYKALYEPFGMFVRPLSMAMDFVDKEKYPDAKQQFRLEELDYGRFEEGGY